MVFPEAFRSPFSTSETICSKSAVKTGEKPMRTIRNGDAQIPGNPAFFAASMSRLRIRLRRTADFSVFLETMTARRFCSSRAGIARNTKKGVETFEPFRKTISKLRVSRSDRGSIHYTESRVRDLARRRARTRRPPGVRIFAKKPWTRFLRRFFRGPIIG